MDRLSILRVNEENKVILQPYQLKNVNESVWKALMNLLFTYRMCNNVPSIIISISKSKILSDQAQTMDDFPQLLMDISYTLTLLQFKPGIIVKATLIHQLQSHLTFLLYDLFNITVQEDELSNNYKWNEEFQSYIFVKTNEVLTKGQEFNLQILQLVGSEFDNRQIEIKGSLKYKQTGITNQENDETDTKIKNIVNKSQLLYQ
ncbi:hypothetical protein pb186bvf_004419 [Paramecium bursaria]